MLWAQIDLAVDTVVSGKVALTNNPVGNNCPSSRVRDSTDEVTDNCGAFVSRFAGFMIDTDTNLEFHASASRSKC